MNMRLSPTTRVGLTAALALSVGACADDGSHDDFVVAAGFGARPQETPTTAQPEATPASASNAASASILHLDRLMDVATVTGSQPPESGLKVMEWSFPADGDAWTPMPALAAGEERDATPSVEALDEGTLIEIDDGVGDRYAGYYVVDLPDLSTNDWSKVEVTMRSQGLQRMSLGRNLGEGDNGVDEPQAWGQRAELVSDGEVHSYRLSVESRSRWSFRRSRGPWNKLVLAFESEEAGAVELRSVRLLPKSAEYSDKPYQVRSVSRGKQLRRSIVFHAPGSLTFPVKVPEGGRFQAAVATYGSNETVAFRLGVNDGEEALWRQEVSNTRGWTPVSVDLSSYAGQEVSLTLGGTSETQGAVAFWSTPTITGGATPDKPNVIFYVIDGAGADLMSVYGYERDTTPELEKLAAEGTVFDFCHTNSGWTKSSTASFMTSLHHSILGGFTTNSDQIPTRAVTMAQHFGRAGYQTAVFTSNPFAGSLSGLQRDVDVFRDQGARDNSASSVELHAEFLEWRDQNPGLPYWVHIQTTDVHEPHDPAEGFAGKFISAEEREHFEEMNRQMRRRRTRADSILGQYRQSLEAAGLDAKEYFRLQNALYDETMAHNDHQLGKLVAELKARGEWDRTLLIVASDHGHPAGSFSRFGRGQLEPQPEEWEGALADSHRTRIPLMMFWPGKIPPGQRISERVSMIDLLPTVLEYVGLEQPAIRQGRSLIPLIEKDADWEAMPIVFDQFQADQRSGEMAGHLEMIDGRWAASLEVVPEAIVEAYRSGDRELVTSGGWRAARPHRATTPSLLLYDLEKDPFCTTNVNEEQPALVQEFSKRLAEQWDAHKVLADQFAGQGEAAPMTAEQLETLRALGYIR